MQKSMSLKYEPASKPLHISHERLAIVGVQNDREMHAVRPPPEKEREREGEREGGRERLCETASKILLKSVSKCGG